MICSFVGLVAGFDHSRLSCRYGGLFNALKHNAARMGLTTAQRHALFHGTAERVYSL